MEIQKEKDCDLKHPKMRKKKGTEQLNNKQTKPSMRTEPGQIYSETKTNQKSRTYNAAKGLISK